MPVPAVNERPVASSLRLAVGALFLVNGILSGAWFIVIPAVKSALSLQAGALGMALFGAPLGALAAMPLAGLLIGRMGGRKVIAVAVMIFVMILPLLPLAPSVGLLFLGLMIHGAANGAIDVGMNAEAAHVERRFGRSIMSLYHGLWSIGAMAGSLIVGFALGHDLQPFPILAVVSAIGLIVFATAILRLPSGPDAGAGPALGRPRRTLLGLGLIALCGLMIEGAMVDWTAVYLTGSLAATAGQASLGLAAFTGTMALGRFGGDILVNRFGRLAVIEVGALAILLGLVTAVVFSQLTLAIAGFALVGIGVACVVPIVFGAAGRTPGMMPGTAIAAVTTMGYCGFMAGPPLIGLIADLSSLGWALALVAGLAVVMAVLAPHALARIP